MSVEVMIIIFIIIGVFQIGVCLSKYCYLGILPVIVYSILFVANQDETYFIGSLIFLGVFFVGVGARILIKYIQRNKKKKENNKVEIKESVK